MKTCYYYSDSTFEYLYSKNIMANEQGEHILPTNATWIEPPKVGAYRVQVYHTDTEEWSIEEDYRQKISSNGIYYGGRLYYYNNQYWWGIGTYMNSIGAIPAGTSFTKITKPDIVINCANLMNERTIGKSYLDSTDKNWIELQAYQNGYRKYLTEEEVAEMEAIEVERDRIATLINSHKTEIATLKEEIKTNYGEEALEHILD